MKKSEFITSTRQLINAHVFMGRSSKLQESLSMLCDALENSTKVDGSKLSAQVTAGWYADAQQTTGGNNMMFPQDAWSWLFENIGKLDNSIYKSTHRQHLEAAFKSGNYSQEVQALWRDVYADQNGPKETSRFKSMNLANEDIFELTVTDEQKLINYILEMTSNVKRGDWYVVANGVEVGIRGSNERKALATDVYSIDINPNTGRLEVFQKTQPLYTPVTLNVDKIYKLLVDKLNLNQPVSSTQYSKN